MTSLDAQQQQRFRGASSAEEDALEDERLLKDPNSTAPTLRILNENKAVTPMMCQSIYWNALEALKAVHATADPLQSAGYLRELYQTQRCDKIGTDLDSKRKDVAVALKMSRLRRLVEQDGGATQEDYIEAHHTVKHYVKWHRDELKGALTWSQWTKYHMTAEIENTAAVVVAVGGLFGFGKWAGPKFVSTWRQYVKPGPATAVKSGLAPPPSK